MLIEIKGVQFVNKGAELMLHAVLEQVGIRYPKACIVLAPGANSSYADRAKIGALQKVQLRRRGFDLNGFSKIIPKRLREYLRRTYGMVFECDIDLVLDATGFAYGDAWGATNSIMAARQLRRIKRNGGDYIFLPQAFGPFTKKDFSDNLSKDFSQASLICARDASSYAHISSFVRGNVVIRQYPDFTNLTLAKIPVDFFDKFRDEKIFLMVPNHNMLNPRNPAHKVWHKRYIELFIQAALAAASMGMKPMILNHEGEADQEICEQLSALSAQSLGQKINVLQFEDPLEVKGLIGRSELVLCSRFHGCVSALSQGVPCLGTSWSHKYEALFSDYHREQYLLSADISDTDLHSLIQSALDSKNEPSYINAISELKKQSEAMWDEVAKHVGR